MSSSDHAVHAGRMRAQRRGTVAILCSAWFLHLTAACTCPDSHPYCYGIHTDGYSYGYQYEANYGDLRCYTDAGVNEANTLACVGTCNADGAIARCACPESHPYCYGIHTDGYSYGYQYEANYGDFRCYLSASSSEFSTTACVGICGADHTVSSLPPSSLLPQPSPSLPLPPPLPSPSPASPRCPSTTEQLCVVPASNAGRRCSCSYVWSTNDSCTSPVRAQLLCW